MEPKNSVQKVFSLGNTTITQGDPTPLPLSRAFGGWASDEPAPTLLTGLRASERRVKLVGRDREIEQTMEWMREPSRAGLDHRVLIIHGPGGAGKTRLAAEILQRADEAGWTAGFLSSNLSGYDNWAYLSHPVEPTMIAVDYAEARYDDLRILLGEAPVGHEGSAPLRLILIIREGLASTQSWPERLAGGRSLPGRAERLLHSDELLVMSLDDSLPLLADRSTLWAAAFETYSNEVVEPPGYLADDLFNRPLFILLDAYRIFSGDPVVDEAPTAGDLIQGILRHEREYWRRSLREVRLDLNERRMNQVAVLATLLGGVDRSGFERALKSLDWLRSDDQLLMAVADWWCLVYATGSGAIRGVEPDPVGEHLAMQAMEESRDPRSQLQGSMQMEQLRSMIEAGGLVERQRVLRVLTRIVNSSPDSKRVRETLTAILSRHLEEFLPATFPQPDMQPASETAGEPLAMTVASAILAADQLELISADSGDVNRDARGLDLAGSAVRESALKHLRGQLDRIAWREFEAGRWSVERLADLKVWAVRLDLEADAPEIAEERVDFLGSLEPRPHKALAIALTELGRHLHGEGEYEAAESFLDAALEELEAIGGRRSPRACVVLEELGNVALLKREIPSAIEYCESAFELRRELRGLTDAITADSFLDLVWAIGSEDPERAVARVEQMVAELTREGADAELVADFQRNRSRAFLAGGRLAEEREEYEAAGAYYTRALEELEKVDGEESLLTFVITHDLGDLALEEGKSETAVELYEAALEGKLRLSGIGNANTISTVIALCSSMAKIDLEDALRRTRDFQEEVRKESFDGFQQLKQLEVDLLANARRFNEAAQLASALQSTEIAWEVKRQVFDAAADPTPDPMTVPNMGMDTLLLASAVFAAGDPRLIALASRLAQVFVEQMGILLASQVEEEALEGFLETGFGERSAARSSRKSAIVQSINDHSKEALDAMGEMTREMPDISELMDLTYDKLREGIGQAIEDPDVIPLVTAGQEEALKLATDPNIRLWLADTAFEGVQLEKASSTQTAVGRLLSFYLGIKGGTITRENLIFDIGSRVWGQDLDPEEVEREQVLLVADLKEARHLEEDEARLLVGMGRVSAQVLAGRAAEREGDYARARGLYERALDEIGSIGQEDTEIAYSIDSDLADVVSFVDPALATRHYESALEGRRRLYGPNDRLSLLTLQRLAIHLARHDLESALALLGQAEESLDEGGDPGLIKRGRAICLLEAGRVLGREEEFERSSLLYQRAIEELHSIGEEDGSLAYGIVHELGSNALGERKTDLAIIRLNYALEGKLKLRGIQDSSTRRTLASLIVPLGYRNLQQALKLLEDAERELADEGAPRKEFAELNHLRARAMMEGGRAAAAAGERSQARSILREGLEQLLLAGEGDSFLFHLITHEIADVLEGDEAAVAPEMRRNAFFALLRLASLPDGSATVGHLEDMATRMARDDVETAIAGLEETLATLAREDSRRADVQRLQRIRARALWTAGRVAEGKRELADAAALYRRALEGLEEAGDGDTVLAYVIHHDLGDALASDDRDAALDHYQLAFEGKRKLLPPGDRGTVSSLAMFIRMLSRTDLPRALSQFQEVLEELRAKGVGEATIFEIGGLQASALLEAGRERYRAGDIAAAASSYQEGLDFLATRGEEESLLGFVIIHDLGTVAAQEGNRQLALQRYQAAYQGKRKLRGIQHYDTITSFLSFLQATGEAADARGEGETVMEEIREISPDDPQISRIEKWIDGRSSA